MQITQENETLTPPLHPRTLGWVGTTALALGGSNQSVFLIGALIAGQGHIPGQGTAAIPLLILGLALAWLAAPGWTELVLMWPNRVGGIASCCAEAFRPYSAVLANLTGTCYWWGWVPTCGLTALLSASAIHQWYLPHAPVPLLACALVAAFALLNLCGVQQVTRFAVPTAAVSAVLAFLSALIPILTGHVNWQVATDFHLTLPFSGVFGSLTAAMAGLYLVGFAAPAFEAATCHVGETKDPAKNVPRAVFAGGTVATLYFCLLPVIWLGVLGPSALSGDLARNLGPTFAPWLGSAAKAAAIWFMIFNMFHGTIQPLAGASRTLAQLAEDGLLPRVFARRSRRDVPWVTTGLTAGMAIVFLLAGDPIWLVAAANLAYLIGIGLPNVAVWLLRRDQPDRVRPYRAPNWTIIAGVASAAVWGLATLLGFQQFGLPTVLFGLALALSGSALYALRRWSDRRHDSPLRADSPRPAHSLHLKLTGSMLLVLALDGAGYLLAIGHVEQGQTALIAGLEDIFVTVALLTLAVGLILPGMVAHTAEEVTEAANRLAGVTLADLSRAMEALGEGNLAAAQVRVDVLPVVVHSHDEMGVMATIFNRMQAEAVRAAGGLDRARESLRQTRQDLLNANIYLEQRVYERTNALEAANQSLRESEERFRSLVQNATDMITILDAAGVIRYQSPAEERLLGHCPEDLIGTSLFMMMHPDDLPQVQPLLVQALQTPGISPPVEFRLRHRDGSWRLLEAICSNLLDDPSVRGIVVNSRDVTERHALEEERERLLAESEARAEREALINRIGVILRNSSDTDRLQPSVMQELGEALGADRCFLSFYDLPKEEVRITHDWRRPALCSLTGCCLSEIQAVAQQLCGLEGTHVIRDGRMTGWPEQAVAALERMELRSAVCVPLIGHGQMAAILCVAMAHEPRDWTPDEVRLVETIAAHTWTALETARSHQREHAIADSLQRALLPPVPRDVPELDFDTHYKAALAEANIGGDFYDVFPLENGSYAFAVGDVSGKGLAAAAQVATVRHMLRTVLYLGLTVAEAVIQLNMLVIDHGLLRGFVTLFVGVYNTHTGILTYVSCGHEPGLIRRAGTSQVEELTSSGLPLSIQREERYTQNLVALSPGDALILFTDGLSEAPSAERDLLGVSGISRMLQESEGRESASLISSLVAGVASYAGPDLRDDLCILAVVIRSVAVNPLILSLMPAPTATPRRRAEDQRPLLLSCAAALDSGVLPEGEDRYRHLIELSPDLVAIVQNGKFVSLNPAGCRLLGADGPEMVLGRPLLEVVHPHWRPVVQGRLRQLVPERMMEGIEQQWVRLDGDGVLVEMSAAATVYAGEPALQILARDITNRREIQEQNVRLLCEVNVAAVRQRLFLRDVLASVTAGRLRLCEEPGDLPPCLNRYSERLDLSRKNLGRLRHRTREAALSLDMPPERLQDLESAVGEAAMNAVAHAGGGKGQVCVGASGTIQVWIQDEGTGIALEHLPQATLERGYTTANTLGHGFWIMLQTVDRVWLLTSPEGTTLVLEQDRTENQPAWHGLADDEPAMEDETASETAMPRPLLAAA